MRRLRLLLLVLMAMVILFALLRAGAGPKIEPGSLLVVDLGGAYVEAVEPASFTCV